MTILSSNTWEVIWYCFIIGAFLFFLLTGTIKRHIDNVIDMVQIITSASDFRFITIIIWTILVIVIKLNYIWFTFETVVVYMVLSKIVSYVVTIINKLNEPLRFAILDTIVINI